MMKMQAGYRAFATRIVSTQTSLLPPRRAHILESAALVAIGLVIFFLVVRG